VAYYRSAAYTMGPYWAVDKLRHVRRALQYMVFALLEPKHALYVHRF
jgi:hypothetical protein